MRKVFAICCCSSKPSAFFSDFCFLLVFSGLCSSKEKAKRAKKKSRGTGKSDHLFFPKEVSNIGLLSSCVTFLYSNSFLRLFQIKTPKGFKVLSFFPIPILLPCFTKKRRWLSLKHDSTYFLLRSFQGQTILLQGEGTYLASEYLQHCSVWEGFFSSELNKKGINGLFPFSGRSDLKGAFKTNIKPFQAV